MRTKISIKFVLLTLSLFGIIATALIIIFPNFELTAQGSYIKKSLILIKRTQLNQIQAKPVENTGLASEKMASLDLPVRLKIPKIQVDAKINPMGVTQEGAMESPVGGKDVGWYKFGSYPGEKGTAVIAGHFGQWKNGDGSVFDELNDLKTGDILYVEDKNGKTISFKVREIRNFEPEADSAVVFSSNDGKSHLNLITCQGTWNKETKSYPKRLVVFTDKN